MAAHSAFAYALFILVCLCSVTSVLSIGVGERVCLGNALNLRNAPCGTVVRSSHGGESGVVTAMQHQSCSFGTYTWVQMNLDGIGSLWGAWETGLISACSSGQKVIPAPYVNQRWDTPDNFDGSWACGPTSAVMAMAAFGKIAAHPITCSYPTAHTSNFGWYVPNVYTSPTGVVFNRMQTDASGRAAWGAYGTCTEGGGAWAWRIQDYAKGHGLVADFYQTATFDLVRSSIDAGNLVVLSTWLTSAGHLILARGYTSNGNIVVNDPWGNANVAGYNGSGEGVTYSWAQAKTAWCVVIRKPAFAAELENLPFPAPKHIVTALYNVTKL